ncbi:uncharacterized protein ColSpa_09419 [Colletotrichum spaethianum]|uniref:Uncharacterized protein n=1 Tax=Colletotrichum spaethianum TaxID=700344 RepID=A0AA37PBJ1_9PEZI|nr:uncharacterized protein ColSpa_09419 [Colletotrichum spaethianum]GKT49238.1 hypothetical protein ColSpa_09419 [Colletotrichum spaethianum]
MFELPDAKRVRREDLDASSEDEAADHDEQQDAELLAKLHARMAGMLDLSGLDQAPTKTAADEDDAPMADGPAPETQGDDNGPEEFEFRLFTTTDPATKIALVDEDELALQGDGDMLRKRPLSYYIAGEPTAEAKAELAFAAVSGDEVLARAAQRWWGMEMPWRVTRVPGTSRKGPKTAAGEGEEEEAARRRRPGKKKRIALRVKERERKKKAEEQERAKMGKEEALKEKKKRLNRLKKLRKRAKAKEGKKGDGEDGADGDDSGSGSDGGDE